MKKCLKLQPDVLFQRIPTNFKIKSTEWEIYIKPPVLFNIPIGFTILIKYLEDRPRKPKYEMDYRNYISALHPFQYKAISHNFSMR